MRNKIIENVLGIVFILCLICAAGFIEEAPLLSGVCALVLLLDVWLVNQLWIDDCEEDE